MPSLKAGAVYFCLVFAAGAILGPIRELVLTPRVGRTAGLLLEAPPMLAVMILAARGSISRFRVASTLQARAGMGLLAFGLLLTAEVAAGMVLRDMSPTEYLAGFRTVFGALSLTLFVVFALVPLLVARR